MSFVIQPVDASEIKRGYDVLKVVGAWLESRGRRQRIAKTSRVTYDRWQAAEGNFAVRDGERFAAVFTVVYEPLRDWPQVKIAGEVPWLRALATHPDYRGRGVGALATKAARRMVGGAAYLYLDCVSDFLPEYYTSLGFETVARQELEITGETPLDVTLLRARGEG